MGDKTQGDIKITADKSAIMDVIADLPSYPEWADGVKGIDVKESFDDGRPKLATFSFASGPIKDEFTLLYDFNGNDSVSWCLTEGHVITQEQGTYTLTDNGDGTVTVLYDLEVGINMPLPGFAKRKAAKQMVKIALNGLKDRVESK
ncbi:MAG: SRPBCC family protein [Actinomycetes bacterium]